MKVNNLLKKVGSVITTAALLATLGTTAFATQYTDSISTNNSITITDVNTVQHKVNNVPVEGVYDVTVSYETTVKNVTGMTLLAYRSNTNDNTPGDMELNSDAQKNAYDDSKYGEGENSPKKMQIVGIEQNAAVDGTSGDGTGSFTFTVTTDSTNNGAYYIAKGKKALVAVSGDQCKPAYALFGVNATAQSAGDVSLGNVEVPANADVNTKLIEEAKGRAVDLYEGKTILKDNVSLGDLKDSDFSDFSNTDNEYTFKAKLTKDNVTVPEGVDFPEAGIEVKFTATITKTAVSAEKITAIEGMTATTVEGNTVFTGAYTPNDSTTLETIKNELVGKKVTLADSTGTVTGQIAIGEGMVFGGTYDESIDEQDITFTVKVGTDAVLDNDLLNVSAEKEATVKIKVSKTAVVNKIELVGNDISVNATKGEDDGATKANIINALKEKLSNGYTFKLTDTKNNVTENVAVGEVEKAWTIEGAGTTFTATLKVTAITKEGFTTKLQEGGVVVTFAKAPVITVTEAPKGMLGDVNGNNKIDLTDVSMALNIYLGVTENPTEYQLWAAKVTKSANVTLKDVSKILNYYLGTIDTFE